MDAAGRDIPDPEQTVNWGRLLQVELLLDAGRDLATRGSQVTKLCSVCRDALSPMPVLTLEEPAAEQRTLLTCCCFNWSETERHS